MARWSAADIPDQTGRIALVTGANSGLGFHTAAQLAEHGAHVLLGVRDAARGQRALDKLTRAVPAATAELLMLDLADLSSVRDAVASVAARHEHLDILVNNAGVMATPYRHTIDGFELQFGTNHLGHFGLTGLLMPLLLAAPASRVVTVASSMHRGGAIAFDDLQSERSYDPYVAYSQSKLSNLLFSAELNRRTAGTTVISVGAHPGLAATNLSRVRPGERHGRLRGRMFGFAAKVVGQSGARGAWPQLYAATMPDVTGGEYFGPGGFGETRGSPIRVDRSPAASDQASGVRLWEVSEELTGVTYDLPVSSA